MVDIRPSGKEVACWLQIPTAGRRYLKKALLVPVNGKADQVQ